MSLLGGLRDLLGRGEKRVRVEGATVEELLERLVEESGRAAEARAAVFADARGVGVGRALARDIRVLVNGRNVRFLDGLETALTEDDSVVLHFTGVRGHPGG